MSAQFFRISLWNGWDAWKNYLPDAWQARAAARKMMCSRWLGLYPPDHELVIETASGSYRVIDKDGNVVPWKTLEVSL